MPYRLQIIDQAPRIFAQIELGDDKLAIDRVRNSLAMFEGVVRQALNAAGVTPQEPIHATLQDYTTAPQAVEASVSVPLHIEPDWDVLLEDF